MTDIIKRNVQDLERRFAIDAVYRPDGSTIITIRDFPLPPGWNRSTTTIRFVVPVGFPIASPDSFWTDPALRLEGGGMPQNTAIQEPWPTEGSYLWFSWHPSNWNAQKDTLLNYVGVIAKRLNEAR